MPNSLSVVIDRPRACNKSNNWFSRLHKTIIVLSLVLNFHYKTNQIKITRITCYTHMCYCLCSCKTHRCRFHVAATMSSWCQRCKSNRHEPDGYLCWKRGMNYWQIQLITATTRETTPTTTHKNYIYNNNSITTTTINTTTTSTLQFRIATSKTYFFQKISNTYARLV